MKSPFKFLDPYTLEDKNSFFGREREEKTLFRLIKKNKISHCLWAFWYRKDKPHSMRLGASV